MRGIQDELKAAEETYHHAYLGQRALLVKGMGSIKARDVPTPKTYREALSSEFAEFWQAAVLKEIKNLEDHEVYEWVELPAGRRAIDATWSFKVKANSAGLVDRFKGRLCAR